MAQRTKAAVEQDVNSLSEKKKGNMGNILRSSHAYETHRAAAVVDSAKSTAINPGVAGG